MDTGHGLSAAAVLELADAGAPANFAERGQLLLAAALGNPAPGHLEFVGLGARDAWLLDLRCATFGDELPVRVACPACGLRVSARIERGTLRVPAPQAPEPATWTVEVEAGDAVVSARTPDGAALLAAAAEPGEEGARRVLIEHCVVEATLAGRPVDPLDLPDETLEAVGEALVEADPAIEIRVTLTCPGCGHEWAPVLDPVLFLWRELDAAAVGISDDVHRLATGYGWSEDEILRLPAHRRRRYVERLLDG